ncbi:MAG: RadC family protein [Clostridia bacterium]|nr:RadC family protein [Clostridia bacterium]
MSENLHKGHRKRLRHELLEQDFPDSVPSHKVLEALLFYGIPQSDTNGIAHELLAKFGSLNGVFEADPNSLFEVKGMTERAVTLIKMILPLTRRIHTEKYQKHYRFKSIDEYGDYIAKHFMGYNNEVFMVTSFDINGNLIENDIISDGHAASVSLSVKKIVKKVLTRNPASVIIAHNHIGQSAVPSFADIQMTQSLKYTLEQIEVKLVDHLIVSGTDYISLAQSGDYSQIFSL